MLPLLLAAALTIQHDGDVPDPSWTLATAFSPDGRYLATSHRDGPVVIWDSATLDRVKILKTHDGGAGALAFSDDGGLLAASGRKSRDHTLALWSTADWKELRRSKGWSKTLVFRPDGSRLFGTREDGLYAWSVPDLKEERIWQGPNRSKTIEGIGTFYDQINKLAVTPDGKTLLVARGEADQFSGNGSLVAFDVESGERTAQFARSGGGWDVAAGDSAAYFVSDRGLEAWDLASSTLLWSNKLEESNSAWYRVGISKDGRYVTALGTGLTVTLRTFDADTGAVLFSTSTGMVGVTESASFANDGRIAFLVANPYRVRQYRLAGQGSGTVRRTRKTRPEPLELPDVDSPPATAAKHDPDALAVVVGIEKYRQKDLPAAEFASRDAETVAAYLTKSMGFDERNVILLQNEEATKGDLEKYLGPWLKNRATEKSRVFIYFSGHGAPDPASGKAFLVPYEGDPQYAEVTAFPLKSLWAGLSQLPAKEMTVILDSCFSGQGQRSLIAKGTRPLVPVQKGAYDAPPRASVIAAAGGSQVSTHYPEARHGLMTYFLLRGLRGEADGDKDGAVSTSELFAYLKPSVERQARLQNVEQTPVLSGSGAAVLIKLK